MIRHEFVNGKTWSPCGINRSKCFLILLLIINGEARAQLSPGPLSRPHAHLEGLKKCGECHELGNREVQQRCLACHDEIAAQRTAGKGLHHLPEYATCTACHTEHHGTDHELAHWQGGQAAFDHRQAGWELTGAHAKLECRKCHNADKVEDPVALRARRKDPDRTFLGLPTACLGCHGDHHRGQFRDGAAPRACAACHTTAAWKPAAGFDHARSAFPLTGRHRKVDCAKCHAALPASAEDGQRTPTARYIPVAHAACTDCHKDPHVGQLGPDCAKCHVTDGWKAISGSGFNHATTKYPLQGRHAKVGCAECHGGGKKKPAFAACRDCHRDAHDAAGRNRPAWLACEDCHTVDGFTPARYGLAKHAQARYPLRGAHQAVPCLLCHKPLGEGKGRQGAYARAVDLAPASARCVDCHRDPHDGQADRFGPAGGPAAVTAAGACLGCHDEASWRKVTFDHGRADWKLEGRHARAACAACHKPVDAGKGKDKARRLPFKVAAKHCAACHQDVHRGQFDDKPVAGAKSADCARCHVPVDWLAEKFDHEKDSRFPLRGGHEKVACGKCHLPMSPDQPRLLHYKGLPVECKACHVTVPAGAKGQS